jgi:hypothetical protein
VVDAEVLGARQHGLSRRQLLLQLPAARLGIPGLGYLPGKSFESVTTAVSTDGSVIAGASRSANGREVVRWTPPGGIAPLGKLHGGLADSEVFIWDASNGMRSPPTSTSSRCLGNGRLRSPVPASPGRVVTFVFENPIAGIIYKRTRLIDTDALFGAPDTIYDASSTRQYELDGAVNWFGISADQRTLEFQTYVPHHRDNLRIITAVPEPGTALLVSASLGWHGRRRGR